MNNAQDIYQFALSEEAKFSQGIDINGWLWSFKEHIKTSFYYKHGRLLEGNSPDIPIKNITRPILNLAYRAEDIDVKDITLYVDDPDSYHLSFLAKKYHDDVFTVENDLDTFIDELKESKIDYGVGIAIKGAEARPEVRDVQSIAFCDQTDINKGPVGFNHFLNPAELMDMADQGWGSEANGATCTLQELIDLSENYRKDNSNSGSQNATPGKYIELKEIIGVMPESYLEDGGDDKKYVNQYQIIGIYRTKEGVKTGSTLFRKKLKGKSIMKVVLRDKIYSRCAGFGGAEELFESQAWTTYTEIKKKQAIDAGALTILKAIGAEMKSKYPNGLKDMENLQIIELNENEDLAQIDTTPRAMSLIEKWEAGWETHAQTTGAASEQALGKEPSAGTPFSSLVAQLRENHSLHLYRQGKYAKDLEWMYQNWFIPHFMDKIAEGTRFLAELSTEEMAYVAECLVRNLTTEAENELILSGQLPFTPEQKAGYEQKVRTDFIKKGNKHFLQALKGEFKKKPLKVKINISGKQKNLAMFTDKLTNIFRQIIANPQGFMQAMQIPEMAKTFNAILESSGLTPVMYAGLQHYNMQPQQAKPTLSPMSPELGGAPNSEVAVQ